MPSTAAVFVIRDGDNVLMEWRDDHPFLGKWSFPGGKIEEDEDPLLALIREAVEELGIAVGGYEPLAEVTSGTWTIYPFIITTYMGEIPDQTDAGAPLKWVPLKYACTSPWPPAQKIACQVRDHVVPKNA